MWARTVLPRLHQPFRPYARRAFSTAELSNGITLAYDVHEPPGLPTKPNAPIVFIHGLFGSKRNNRGMSKYAASRSRHAHWEKKLKLTSIISGFWRAT